jgi:hypothetical protein
MLKKLNTKVPRKIHTIHVISVLNNLIPSGKQIIYLVLTGIVQMDHKFYQHYSEKARIYWCYYHMKLTGSNQFYYFNGSFLYMPTIYGRVAYLQQSSEGRLWVCLVARVIWNSLSHLRYLTSYKLVSDFVMCLLVRMCWNKLNWYFVW